MQKTSTAGRFAATCAALLLSLFAAPPLHAGKPAEHGRFHHVHLNVADPDRTAAFYAKVFGVTPTRYAGRIPALLSERAFVFLDTPAAPIRSQLHTGLIHIGWGGVDGPSEFAYWQKQGIEFYTPLSPLGIAHYFYLYGPDREVIEIWTTERHHRLNHVHMLAEDPAAVGRWFQAVTNPELPVGPAAAGLGTVTIDYGDVALHILPDAGATRPKERTGAMQPTDGSGIDHVAIAFEDLEAAYRRVRKASVAIERPLRTDPKTGLRHFFVRAPNGVLVEMVKARPLPEAAWR